MKKKNILISFFLVLVLSCTVFVSAGATSSYVVKSGDSLWKIAVKYQAGVSELIAANPSLANPDLIYPGQTIQIPSTDDSVRAFEKEVVRLVNEKRAENGLKPLTENWELSRVARYKS